MKNYQGPLYAPHPDIMRDYPLYKLQVWNNTANAVTLWPIERCDFNYIQNQITKYLHDVMHTQGEVIDDQY